MARAIEINENIFVVIDHGEIWLEVEGREGTLVATGLTKADAKALRKALKRAESG